ncbi:MAG: hypothetical protein LBN27_06280 [Prevotellaceae bacterium]|jgi:hypothetical protein|nr:hypothetical protein [Prevotellaceae bacterium]
MKKYLLCLMLLPLLAFVSCDKDKDEDKKQKEDNTEVTDDDENNGKTQNTPAINAKWEISDPASPYTSFEFTKDGNYIVVEKQEPMAARAKKQTTAKSFLPPLQNSAARKASTTADSNLSPVHFGTYTIDGNKIILSGFGVIDIIDITAEEFNFSFTLEETGETAVYVANKSTEPISTSSRTDMFCRTWKIDSISVNTNTISLIDSIIFYQQYGDDWLEKYIEAEMNDKREHQSEVFNATVLFSKAGTYLVLYTNGESGLSEWKWTNEEQTDIYYSWDNWENNWENSIVHIELNNSTLKLFDNEYIFHLIPAE